MWEELSFCDKNQYVLGCGGAVIVFHALSIVDVIQSGIDRIFFFLATAGSCEKKYDKFAIGENKAKIQQKQRIEKILVCV